MILLLLIVCDGWHMRCAEELNCKYEYIFFGYGIRDIYTCVVNQLENSNDNMIITGTKESSINVELIYMHGTKTKFIPKNLGSSFNLRGLFMQSAELIEIRSKDFNKMENLKFVSFQYNQLTSVPSDAFSTLPKLQYIWLNFNEIIEIPQGLFDNNLDLEQIFLNENKIKFIGSGLFNGLTKLYNVHLGKNICVNRLYYNADALIQLKNDVENNCINPTLPTTTPSLSTTTTTTTQNPIDAANLTPTAPTLSTPFNEILKCEYKIRKYHLLGDIYTCHINSLDNLNNIMVMNGTSEKNENVKAIYIHHTNAQYIPANLGNLYNLTAFSFDSSKLIEINSVNFHGMDDLEFLSFYENPLKFLPSDAFNTLTKLRVIYLHHNQIEELPNQLFSNNLKLEWIDLSNNKIKYIGHDLLNDLQKKTHIFLSDNICVNNNYLIYFNIEDLKEKIRNKCFNPNTTPATPTTTTMNPIIATTTTSRTTTTPTPFNAFMRKWSDLFDKLMTDLKEANDKLKNGTTII